MVNLSVIYERIFVVKFASTHAQGIMHCTVIASAAPCVILSVDVCFKAVHARCTYCLDHQSELFLG